jgi:hypothetical protein
MMDSALETEYLRSHFVGPFKRSCSLPPTDDDAFSFGRLNPHAFSKARGTLARNESNESTWTKALRP